MTRLLLAALTAVATTTTAQTAGEVTPRCATAFECEVAWSEAQRTLGMVSNMRVRFATQDRIETYAPTRAGTVGAIVSKIPVSPGTYEIQIELHCYRSIPCDKVQADGTRLFNLGVNAGLAAKKPLGNQ